MTQNNLSFKEEVIIPAGKAIVFGGFSALTAIAVMRARAEPADAWGIVFGLVVSSASYWIITWRSIPRVEPLPEPKEMIKTYAQEVEITLVDRTEPNYPRGKFIKTQIHQDKLVELARHLKHGGKFSGSELGGKGKLFSRSDYERVRKDFIDGNMVEWVNPHAHTVGLELTIGGRAFVRHYSSLNLTSEQTPPLRLVNTRDRLVSPFNAKAHTKTQKRAA